MKEVRPAARVSILAILLTATSLLCEVAYAKDPKPFGFAISGGYSSYAMSDVNDALETPGTIFPGSSTNADEIKGGPQFGLGFRVWPSSRVKVGFDAAQLLGSTSGTAVFLGTPYDGELETDATTLTLTTTYQFLSSGKLGAGLGAGVGYYFSSGSVTATGGGNSFSEDVGGSGFGFHFRGEGDVALSRRVHTEIALGYRAAKSSDVEVSRSTVYNADGSKAQIDWSGVTASVGFVIYTGSRVPGNLTAP